MQKFCFLTSEVIVHLNELSSGSRSSFSRIGINMNSPLNRVWRENKVKIIAIMETKLRIYIRF